MVAHPQIDTSTLDHIKRIAQNHTELARAVGRGQPALRDPSGNILALDPASSTPLLAAQGHDVALNMQSGALRVTDETGQNLRAVEAQQVSVDTANVAGRMDVGADLHASDLYATHDLNVTNVANVSGWVSSPKFFGEIGNPGHAWHAYITSHGTHHGPVNPQVQGPEGPRGWDGPPGPPGPAGPKGFVVDHPTDPDRWLVHACTEAPHNGVEYWGYTELSNGWAEVFLPPYFEDLVEVRLRTVHLTPMAPAGWTPVRNWRPWRKAPVLSASYPTDGRFRILADDNSSRAQVWWLVKGVRKDLPALLEAPLRSEVKVSGFGPYRTYSVVTDPEDPAQQLPDTVDGPTDLVHNLWAALGIEQTRTDALEALVRQLITAHNERTASDEAPQGDTTS